MRTPEERIQFIAEYISAYEEKVKLLNKNGFLMQRRYLNCLQSRWEAYIWVRNSAT